MATSLLGSRTCVGCAGWRRGVGGLSDGLEETADRTVWKSLLGKVTDSRQAVAQAPLGYRIGSQMRNSGTIQQPRGFVCSTSRRGWSCGLEESEERTKYYVGDLVLPVDNSERTCRKTVDRYGVKAGMGNGALVARVAGRCMRRGRIRHRSRNPSRNTTL